MTEQIGKIILDFSKYPGEDFYCDGAVEDEILEIVQNNSSEDYNKIIEERKSWPILYHLSSLRENIIDWIPMDKQTKVLEVGSGCGAITGSLSRKAGSVTCIDLSKKRSRINAYRHKDCENITISVGNFKDIEPELDSDFDMIFLIGVFEYGQSYIHTAAPFEDFLKILQKHLKNEGRIFIAIENKYGIKYFAGCKEDHLGTYFSGIENYSQGEGVRTFSRKGLEQIFQMCKAEEFHFYYPYPDYKFATTIYSDSYLPRKGELSNNIRNFDRDRLLLFDEKSAFDGIIEDGLFPIFSNSFLAVIGKDFPIQYVKYSNDRAKEYQIRTEIRCENQIRSVYKYPMSEEAKKHIYSMETAYKKLLNKYQGSKLEINPCMLQRENDCVYAKFDFVTGIPLSQFMDNCLNRQDLDGFYQYFQEYLQRIEYHSDYPVSDFDLIFSNILVSQDTWTLIDYEWTFEQPIAAAKLAFRAIYCYLLEDKRRKCLKIEKILEKLNLSEKEAQKIKEQEMEFQEFVTGKRLSMPQLRELLGGQVQMLPQKLPKYQTEEDKMRVQLYWDKGNGYSEEESAFLSKTKKEGNKIEVAYKISGQVKQLRIDPAMCPCICRVIEITWNGEAIPLQKRKLITVNGKFLKSTKKDNLSIVFPTKDPNINLDMQYVSLKRKSENSLCVKLEVIRLSLTAAINIANSIKKF